MDESPSAQAVKVLVLYTGGTIGMGPRDASPESPLVPQPLPALLKYAVGLEGLGIELSYEQFAEPLDSSNVGPAQWRMMARVIERGYEEYEGFVILHGTDTMAYTASALAFMFEHLGKPVVITGSQLPISHPRTDARQNLVNAVMVAGHRAAGLPCIPEVVIVFADKILRGCRASKVSSTAWAGFDSPNFPALGTIGERIRVATEYLRAKPPVGAWFGVNYDFVEDVIEVGIFPGMKAAQLRAVLGLDSVRGAVLRTFGSGNAPQDPEFLAAIGEAVAEKARTIINITQCHQGMVEMGLYAASNGLLERGVVSGLDMTPEAALTKLMWALGAYSGSEVARQLQIGQRGEQSENLYDLRFGASGAAGALHREFVGTQRLEVGFAPARLARAVLRISGLRVGSPAGARAQLQIAVEKRDAPERWQTVACLPALAGETPSVVRSLDLTLVAMGLHAGTMRLRVAGEEGAVFGFERLSLALFAAA